MQNGKQPSYPLSATAANMINGGYGLEFIGLTKREYFATMAMQGLVHKLNGLSDNDDAKLIVRTAVIMADELLMQLEK